MRLTLRGEDRANDPPSTDHLPKRPSSKRRTILSLGVPLASALCFFAVGGVFCAATLRVRKGAAVTPPPGAQDVGITASDGARLRAWWMRPPASNGNCVIVLHGIKESRRTGARFASMFLSRSYSVLIPDSRAHGESGGEFVTYGLLEKYDVTRWRRWMTANGCQKIYGLASRSAPQYSFRHPRSSPPSPQL
jgi:hypothetical protein